MCKKIFAVSMSILCLISAFFVKAERSENTAGNNILNYKDYNATESYASYIEKNNKVMPAKNSFENEISKELNNSGDYIEWSVDIQEDAFYQPEIIYTAIEKTGGDIEMSLTVDGKVPYEQADSFLLFRMWKNSTDEFEEDNNGNQYSPEQTEVLKTQSMQIMDSDGFETHPLKLALSRGKHILRLTLLNEAVKIEKVVLSIPESIPNYEEYKSKFEDNSIYDGDEIVIEGEKADYKTQKSFIPLADKNSSVVSPADPIHKKMNYIGGSNWNSLGGALTWQIDIKESGWYKLGFHFRQNYIMEGVSYRKLLIDGKVPFSEAEAIAFSYNSGWQSTSLKDDDGDDMPVFLIKGKHTLSLSVTLGNLSDYAKELKDVTDIMGTLYRKIVKITGETPDSNRDYELFRAIPELEDQLKDISSRLNKLALNSEKTAGSKGGSNAQIVRKALITVNQMLKVKYEAHNRVTTFYDNYSSLCSWLYEMQNMSLDIDCLMLTSPTKSFSVGNVGFGSKITFFLKRLFSTYTSDYKKNDNKGNDSITLWLNWGRDQITLLENLISNDFTPKTGINVDVKITGTSLVEAGLAGNGPDFQLSVDRTAPLNYAMRGLLYDLSQFDDYNEITKRFSKNSSVPYEYNGGVYGLPSTETFNMMFIRNDVFEELGLDIPKTWDDFIQCAKIITLNNMNCGMVSDVGIFLTQMNVPMYNDEHTATNLTSSGAVGAFTFMTDFFTKYKFPVTYSFFNRFRTGLMPMAIAAYSENANLRAAAPEINGKWHMYEMPGMVSEDGKINNSVNGSGTACVILNWATDEKKQKAWEFLKWWTSDEIQSRYSLNIESILGASGRYTSANLNAVYSLGWDEETLDAIKAQFSTLQNFPEVPGSYYVARSTQQVFWNVVNNGQDVEDMLDKWIPEADDEIIRKTEEYVFR